MLLRILIGFLVAGLGFLMVWKTEWFQSMLGYVDWAEKTFGGGGTRFFYKLLGITIIVIGFLVVTNLFDLIIGGFFRSIFSY